MYTTQQSDFRREVVIRDVSGRFKDVSGRFKDVSGRFRDVLGRFRDVSGRFKDVLGRFRDVSGRFRLSGHVLPVWQEDNEPCNVQGWNPAQCWHWHYLYLPLEPTEAVFNYWPANTTVLPNFKFKFKFIIWWYVCFCIKRNDCIV